MSTANARLCRDSMLRDTCTWYARTGGSESSGNVTQTYDSAVTLKCNVGQPNSRWTTQYPDIQLDGSMEFWLPASSTVARRDKIIYGGVSYFVQEVANWNGAGVVAVASSHAGIS